MPRDSTSPHGRFGGPNTIGVGVFTEFSGRVPEPPPRPGDPRPAPEPLPEPAPDPAPSPPTPNPITRLSGADSGSTSAAKFSISTAARSEPSRQPRIETASSSLCRPASRLPIVDSAVRL
jgi:hypothetical protein